MRKEFIDIFQILKTAFNPIFISYLLAKWQLAYDQLGGGNFIAWYETI